MDVDTETKDLVRLTPTRIDCKINHPVFGWIPFTADARDVEPHGRAIFAEVDSEVSPAA